MNWDSPATIAKLFALMVFAIVADVLIVTYPRWLTVFQSEDSAEEENRPSCLKVSDFYAVHLTTHFAAEPADGATQQNKKLLKFEPYCDRVPGPGQVVFTVDLMEKDVRALPVGLSFFKSGADGKRALVKALPPARHTSGVLTLDIPKVERGKYVLKAAFGDAKTSDDVIEMPIQVGN